MFRLKIKRKLKHLKHHFLCNQSSKFKVHLPAATLLIEAIIISHITYHVKENFLYYKMVKCKTLKIKTESVTGHKVCVTGH